MIKSGFNFKTVIVLIILVLIMVLGVLGINTVRTYMSGAANGIEPVNVSASPSEDGKSAVVSWTTEKPTIGIVEYGTNAASLLLRAIENDAVTEHRVSLSPLKTNMSYYYRIRVDDEIFDNSGIPYSFKTVGEEIKPTAIPTAVITPIISNPSSSSGSSSCDKKTDYNKDSVINSLDYLYCIKNGTGTSQGVNLSPTPVASSSASGCDSNTDYDGNGVVNSLDRTKCLQNRAI